MFANSTGKGLTDAPVRKLVEGCPELQEVDVRYAQSVSIEIRVELARRLDLKELWLFCGFDAHRWLAMTAQLAQALLTVCPNLTHLECWDERARLTDVTLTTCAQHCPLLQSIHLKDCAAITSAGIVALAVPGSKLQDVWLENCAAVDDASLTALSANCAELQSINLDDCRNFTVEGLWAIARPGNALRSLSLAQCNQLDDAAVLAIAERCPQLRSLHLPESLAITDRSIIPLAKGCPDLSYLHMGHCRGITVASLQALADHCEDLCEITVPSCFQEDPVLEFFKEWPKYEYTDEEWAAIEWAIEEEERLDSLAQDSDHSNDEDGDGAAVDA